MMKTTRQVRPEVAVRSQSVLHMSFGYIVLGLLIATLMIVPFRQGLFYPIDLLAACAVILLLCAVGVLYYRTGKQSTTIGLVPLLGLGLVLVYALGLLWPASAYSAIRGVLKWSACIALFAVFSMARDELMRKLLAWGVMLSATALAVTGLAGLLGKEIIAGAFLHGRITAGLGYTNATANLFVLGIVLAVTVGLSEKKKSLAWVAGVCGQMLVSALVLTMSRAGWATAAFAAMAILVLNWRNLAQTFVRLVLVYGAGVVGAVLLTIRPEYGTVAPLFAGYCIVALLTVALSRAQALIAAVAALILVIGAGGFIGHRVLVAPNDYILVSGDKSTAGHVMRVELGGLEQGVDYVFKAGLSAENSGKASFGAQLTLQVAGENEAAKQIHFKRVVNGTEQIAHEFELSPGYDKLIVLFHGHFPGVKAVLANPVLIAGDQHYPIEHLAYKLLPQNLAARVGQFDTKVLGRDGRLDYYKDSVPLVKAAPILGRGGGAWNALYQTVQSKDYSSRSVHSDPLEIVLEAGFVGLFLYAALLVLVLWGAFRRGDHVQQGLGLAALAFVVHSSVEALSVFNALYFIVFALLGAAYTGTEPRLNMLKIKSPKQWIFGMAGCLLLMGVFSGVLFMSEHEVAQYARKVAQRQNPDALASIQKAMTLNPWHVDRYLDLARLQWWDLSKGEQVASSLRKAQRLEPYDNNVVNLMGSYYYQRGDYDKALEYYKKAISLAPKDVANYEILAMVAAETAVETYPKDRAMAQIYAELAEETFKAGEDLLLNSKPKKRVTAALRFAYGQVLALRGEWSKAEPHFGAAVRGQKNEAFQGKAALWAARAYQKVGRAKDAQAILDTLLLADGFQTYWGVIVAATGGN